MTEERDICGAAPENIVKEASAPELPEGFEDLESALLAATEELEGALAEDIAELEEAVEGPAVPKSALAEPAPPNPHMEMQFEPRRPRPAGAGKMHGDFIRDIPVNPRSSDIKRAAKEDGVRKHRRSLHLGGKRRGEKTVRDMDPRSAEREKKPLLSMEQPFAGDERRGSSMAGLRLGKFGQLALDTESGGKLSGAPENSGLNRVSGENAAPDEKLSGFAEPAAQKAEDSFSSLQKTVARQPDIMRDKAPAPKPPRQHESKQREIPRAVPGPWEKAERPKPQKPQNTFSSVPKNTSRPLDTMRNKATSPKPPRQQEPRRREMLLDDAASMKITAASNKPVGEQPRQMALKEKKALAPSFRMDFDEKKKSDDLMEMDRGGQGKRKQDPDFKICL